jgi:nitrous oxidase accessory protein
VAVAGGGAVIRGLAAWLFVVTAAGLAAAEPSRLQQAIDAAPPGTTIEVPAGTHAGPLVIRQPLRLRGTPGAVIDGQGRGHVIDIQAAGVEVTGLLIRRSGSNLSNDDAGIHVRADRAIIRDNTIVDTLHGIYLRKADHCRLERNVIRGRAAPAAIADPLTQGLKLSSDELCSVELQQDRRGNGIHIWNCSRHLIADNDIRGTRDGIYFQFCDDTRIVRNTIADVRYGLHYMYSDGNVFEENLFTRNAAGSAIMYSNDLTLRRNRFVANRSHRAYGLLMHTVERTRIEDNVIDGNTVGIFLENSTSNQFVGNSLRANYIALRLSDSSDTNGFGGNVFKGNVHAVETSGLNETNRFTRDGGGNYWDGALKTDLNGDGFADAPHHETDLFGRWRRTFPEIGLLSGSPGERAIRFMHTRVRVPGVPGVKDDRPLARAGRP